MPATAPLESRRRNFISIAPNNRVDGLASQLIKSTITMADGNENAIRASTTRLAYDGHGTIRWADGAVYEGQFKAGEAEGHGMFKVPSGAAYEGEFKDGVRNGPRHVPVGRGQVVRGRVEGE